jgi:hypothetical protein
MMVELSTNEALDKANLFFELFLSVWFLLLYSFLTYHLVVAQYGFIPTRAKQSEWFSVDTNTTDCLSLCQ